MTTPVEVDILDGRADPPGWPECGFVRLDHASAVTDWTDDGAIAAVHYLEAEAIAPALTGAEHTLVADHVRRNAEDAKRRGSSNRSGSCTPPSTTTTATSSAATTAR